MQPLPWGSAWRKALCSLSEGCTAGICAPFCFGPCPLAREELGHLCRFPAKGACCWIWHLGFWSWPLKSPDWQGHFRHNLSNKSCSSRSLPREARTTVHTELMPATVSAGWLGEFGHLWGHCRMWREPSPCLQCSKSCSGYWRGKVFASGSAGQWIFLKEQRGRIGFPGISIGWLPELVLCCRWESLLLRRLWSVGARFCFLRAVWEQRDFSRSFIITFVSIEMFGAIPGTGLSCSSSVSELGAGALERGRPADGSAKVLGRGEGHIRINKDVPMVCLLHQVCLCGIFLRNACRIIKLGEIPGSGEALAWWKRWETECPWNWGCWSSIVTLIYYDL